MDTSKEELNRIFTSYYHNNSWGSLESRSGPGSTVYESQQLIIQLPELLKQLKITTILDAPCGDFNWMKEIDLDGYQYTGVDIVADCISANQGKYGCSNITFLVKEIMHDPLPKADIILCRDALVHFSNDGVAKTVQNFKKSGSTYLLTTHFPHILSNKNIQLGDWRPINFTLEPFYFCEPQIMIKETLPIKTMALWKLDEIIF